MPTGFPSEFKEEVKNSITVEELLNEYTDEKYRGNSFTCIIPDHSDDTDPSMWYHQEDDNIHCYGCEAHIWDPISFLQQVEKMSFKEAVFTLAGRANISVPSNISKKMKKENKKRNEITAEMRKFWKNLKKGSSQQAIKAKKYLKDRNISKETINRFGIGFCPDNKIYANKKNMFYKFRDRIMFPLFDEHNKIHGFAGRILPGDHDENKFKYRNCSKNNVPFFNKNILYGLNEAKKDVIKQGYVYIFEGYMDVITAFENDIKNTVAVMGTSIKDEQLKRLSELTSKAIVYLDSDEAGLNGVIRAIDMFEKYDIAIEVLYSNDGSDPDDKINQLGNGFEDWAHNNTRCPEQLYIDLYLKEHKEDLREARVYRDNKIKQIKKEYRHKKQKSLRKLVRKYAKSFNGRLDRLEVDFFLRGAAEDLNISYEALKKRMDRVET